MRPLEGLSSIGDSYEHPLGRAMVHNCAAAPEPRDTTLWLVPAPSEFNVPPKGGRATVLTSENEIWVGTVLWRAGRRVRLRLLGSNVVAMFDGCAVAPLKAHSLAEERQIVARQKRYEPAAQLQKWRRKIMTQQPDTEIDETTEPDTEPAPQLGFARLDRPLELVFVKEDEVQP